MISWEEAVKIKQEFEVYIGSDYFTLKDAMNMELIATAENGGYDIYAVQKGSATYMARFEGQSVIVEIIYW